MAKRRSNVKAPKETKKGCGFIGDFTKSENSCGFMKFQVMLKRPCTALLQQSVLTISRNISLDNLHRYFGTIRIELAAVQVDGDQHAGIPYFP